MPESHFRNDIRFEKIIGSFLDNYFYARLFPNTERSVTRVSNEDLQNAGIDVIVERNDDGTSTNIDEKCAAHFINFNLPTFAFEITGTGGRPGWLVKNGIRTDYYLLVWIHANEQRYPPTEGANDYYETIEEEDIEYLSCCFLKKETLLQYLEKKGFSKDNLLAKASEMIKKDIGSDKSHKQRDGFYFIYSKDNLKEKPVNVVIRKAVLKSLATIEGVCFCYLVNRNGYTRTDRLL